MEKYIVITSILTIFAYMPALGQSLLAPPFGLKWGESPETILEWAENNKLEIQITSPPYERKTEHILVQALRGLLPNHEAKKIETRYFEGKLYEVSVYYQGYKNINSSEIKKAFDEIKSDFEKLYGPLKKNRNKKSISDDFETTSIGYHIEPAPGLILFLAFTELKDLLRKEKSSSQFTLIYHNDSLAPKAEEVRK